MNSKSSFVLLMVTGALAACGGGGDSESTPTRTSGDVSFDQSYVTAAEASTVEVSGSFAGHRQVQVVSDNRTQVSVSISADQTHLVIRPREVDRPRTLNLALVFGDDPQQSPVDLTVHVENTSAIGMEQQVSDLLAQREALLSLEQERVLYHFFVDIAYLESDISHSGKQQLMDQFLPSASPHHASTRNAFEKLQQNQDQYERGSLPDYLLTEALNTLQDELELHAGFGAEKLADIAEHTELAAPGFKQALTNSKPEYSDETGIYSRFLSDAFGRFEGDQFVLDSAYAPLEDLIRSRKQQEIACDTI